MEQLGIPFRGHGDTGRLEPVSDINDIDTSAENFRVILQLYSMGNPKFPAHHKESLSDATYLSPNILNELIALTQCFSKWVSRHIGVSRKICKCVASFLRNNKMFLK